MSCVRLQIPTSGAGGDKLRRATVSDNLKAAAMDSDASAAADRASSAARVYHGLLGASEPGPKVYDGPGRHGGAHATYKFSPSPAVHIKRCDHRPPRSSFKL